MTGKQSCLKNYYESRGVFVYITLTIRDGSVRKIFWAAVWIDFDTSVTPARRKKHITRILLYKKEAPRKMTCIFVKLFYRRAAARYLSPDGERQLAER